MGFLSLPWVQRHTGKGVDVGEKKGMGLGWPLGGKWMRGSDTKVQGPSRIGKKWETAKPRDGKED